MKDTGGGVGGADCAHEVCQVGQGVDTQTVKGRGSGDVP